MHYPRISFVPNSVAKEIVLNAKLTKLLFIGTKSVISNMHCPIHNGNLTLCLIYYEIDINDNNYESFKFSIEVSL